MMKKTRTRSLCEIYKITNGKKLTMLYLKNDLLLVWDIFRSYMNTCITAFGFNPFSSFELPNFTWKIGLKDAGVQSDSIVDKELKLLIEKKHQRWPCIFNGKVFCENKRFKKLTIVGF